MRVVVAVFGILAGAGCVRASESTVREIAGQAFNCADYALSVVEVGPDVYRASGCGQEVIYACAPASAHRTAAVRAAQNDAPQEAQHESADAPEEPVMQCSRRPR
jgi:hypothetical protein